MDRIIQMVIRMVISKVMNKGISAGVDRMTRGKQGENSTEGPKMNDDMKKRANLARRLGRF